MFRVVKNNRVYLQLLADCPHQQRQFLLKTASPQQMHALVQIIHKNKRKLLPHKDALLNLGKLDVPYKTKKQTLVQEGGNFIQDLLTPVITSLGFLML